MTEAELEAIIARGESERVEFKSNANDSEALRIAVCALANDLSNSKSVGYLIIGVDDAGRPTSPKTGDRELQKIAHIRSQGDLQPLPSMTVDRYDIDRYAYIVAQVNPSSDPPIRYRGRVYVRIGSTSQIANPQDERVLVERRQTSDLPFDHQRVHEADILSVDLDYFTGAYLPRAYAPDVLEANGRSVDEQLVALRFYNPPHPTFGGILTLGRSPERYIPGAYIQFVAYNGPALTDEILDQKKIGGRLEHVATAILELLSLAIPRSLSRSDGPRHTEHSAYPVTAVREFVINAIMHRDYRSGNAPIRITLFSDRLEILSPGGPLAPIRPDRFGETGETAYRNPIVADALRTLGFAQRFGFGIPHAQKVLAENGNNRAEFAADLHYVNVTLRSAWSDL